METVNILVIEDDDTVGRTIERSLRGHEFRGRCTLFFVPPSNVNSVVSFDEIIPVQVPPLVPCNRY